MEVTGNAPQQVPRNLELGRLAFMSPAGLVLEPVASAEPAENGQMVFELASNTSLRVRVRGSDGVVRSATLTLA